MQTCFIHERFKGKWPSGRRRQTVNLLVKLTLVRIQSFSRISLHANHLITKKQRVQIFSKKLKTLYYTIQINRKFRNCATFEFTKNYKLYINLYHYDNFRSKNINYKIDLILVKLNNFKFFVEHFDTVFVNLNHNF